MCDWKTPPTKAATLRNDTVAGLEKINAAIMAHGWGRLGALYVGKALVGQQARDWDIQTVIFEQAQNQPLQQVFTELSKNSISEL